VSDIAARPSETGRNAGSGSVSHQTERAARRPYEAPHLIRYGHVKELTAGTKAGVQDLALNSSIV